MGLDILLKFSVQNWGDGEYNHEKLLLAYMLQLYMIRSSMERAEYMKKHEFFHSVGDRVMITSRKILHAKFISIGNNVWMASDVEFIAHDVKVGNNVIIAAGTIVNKDVPSNSVVGGVPAGVISLLDDYLEKRREFTVEHPVDNAEQEILPECEEEMWWFFIITA